MANRVWRCWKMRSLLGLLAVATSAGAQSKIELPSRLSCSKCRIERVLVATLRDSGTTALLGGKGKRTTVATDSKGRFYVSDADRTRIAVFGANGLLIRTIGREGDGPGEFRQITRITVTRGDTIRVYESVPPRESIFAPTHDFVRLRPAPRSMLSFAMLSDGRLVGNIVSGQPDLVGLPLHLTDSTGAIALSFGSDDPVFRAGMQGLLNRSVTLDSDDAVYAAHSQAYKIELWSLRSGKLLREYSRSVSWFKPRTQMPDIEKGIEPPPHTEDVFRAADGFLWMNIQRADRTFWFAIVAGGLHGKTVNDVNKYLDSTFEVVDPIGGRVLASRRFDEPSYSMFRDGLVFSPSFGSNDEPRIKIWRLYLRSP